MQDGFLTRLLVEVLPDLGESDEVGPVRGDALHQFLANPPDRVIVQGQRAADAAGGEPREPIALRGIGNAVLFQNGYDIRVVQWYELHDLTARQNGRELPIGPGGDEEQDRAGRRLFERLQEAVRGFGVEVVRILDNANHASAA